MPTVEVYEIDGQIYTEDVDDLASVKQKKLVLPDGYYAFIAWCVKMAKEYGQDNPVTFSNDIYYWTEGDRYD